MGKLIDINGLSTFKTKLRESIVSYPSVGSVSSLEQLQTLLSAKLATMDNYTWCSLRFNVAEGANFDVFVSRVVYYCTLYRGGTYNQVPSYAHVMIYPNVATYIISGYIGDASDGATWQFKRLARQDSVDTLQTKIDNAVSLDDLGSISNYDGLVASLNAKLNNMQADTWCTIQFRATAAFNDFASDVVYYGTLYRYDYTVFARVIFYGAANMDIISGQISLNATWKFQCVDGSSNAKYLGQFTTNEELTTLLNTELAAMPNHSARTIWVWTKATVDEFANNSIWHGMLYKNAGTAYAHVILYANASTMVITGNTDTNNVWTYRRLANKAELDAVQNNVDAVQTKVNSVANLDNLGDNYATLESLIEAINTKLSNMSNNTCCSIQFKVTATFGVFIQTHRYYGHLYRGSSTLWSHIILYSNANMDIITGEKDGTNNTGIWEFECIGTAKYLGAFSETSGPSGLDAYLNNELSTMESHTCRAIWASVPQNAEIYNNSNGVFTANTAYHGVLYTNTSVTKYAHVMLYSTARTDVVSGFCNNAGEWTYDRLATKAQLDAVQTSLNNVNTKAEATKTALGNLYQYYILVQANGSATIRTESTIPCLIFTSHATSAAFVSISFASIPNSTTTTPLVVPITTAGSSVEIDAQTPGAVIVKNKSTSTALTLAVIRLAGTANFTITTATASA